MIQSLTGIKCLGAIGLGWALLVSGNPAIAQASRSTTSPSVDTSLSNGEYASMQAEDLQLDQLDYLPPTNQPQTPDYDGLPVLETRRQDANLVELESLTLYLTDPQLSNHDQGSGFSVSSPIE